MGIKKRYKECLNYLGKIRNYYLAVVLIFFAAFILGVIYPELLGEELKRYIADILEKTQGLNGLEMFFFIFLNNLSTSFFSVVFGFFAGIFPVIVSFINGYILGFVLSKTIAADGLVSVWRIVPHGIFELPAFIISVALGLKLGMFVFAKKKIDYLRKNFKLSLKVFLYIVLPLLLIAGIIEAFLIFLVR